MKNSSQEIFETPSKNQGTNQTNFSTPNYLNHTQELSETDIDRKKYLASQIVDEFIFKNIKKAIFDFDGTITKHHSMIDLIDDENGTRANPRILDWFADKIILQEILQLGVDNNIKFYIASKQDSKVIRGILGDLSNFFKEINGSDNSEKKGAIERIAAHSSELAIYFDDDFESISNKNVLIIKNLLDPLPHKPNQTNFTKKRKYTPEAVEGEAGLNEAKWEMFLERFREENYNLEQEELEQKQNNTINFQDDFLTSLNTSTTILQHSISSSDIPISSPNHVSTQNLQDRRIIEKFSPLTEFYTKKFNTETPKHSYTSGFLDDILNEPTGEKNTTSSEAKKNSQNSGR